MTFDNCTMHDVNGDPHMMVPRDMYGKPCFPEDLLCDECDHEKLHPFKVVGIRCYDGEHGGIHEVVIADDGNWYFADECYHV